MRGKRALSGGWANVGERFFFFKKKKRKEQACLEGGSFFLFIEGAALCGDPGCGQGSVREMLAPLQKFVQIVNRLAVLVCTGNARSP